MMPDGLDLYSWKREFVIGIWMGIWFSKFGIVTSADVIFERPIVV